MGTKYTAVSVTGYNSSPPSDDGSTTDANKIKWSTIKSKLPDPLKTAIEAIDSALQTFTNFGSRQVTTSDTTLTSDHMKTVEIASTVTASITISLGDAATMAAGYIVTVKNSSSVTQTVSRITSGDTIENSANRILLPAGASVTVKLTGTNYAIQSMSPGVGVASYVPGLYNGAIGGTVSTNALTVTLKTLAGANATPNEPIYIGFRDATVTSGTHVVRAVTAALSVILPAGQALGFANSESGRIHVGAIDYQGTVELCLGRAISTSAAPTNSGYECTGLVRFADVGVVSTTAISSASSALTLYSTSARSNVAFTYLGYIEIQTGSTAGNWSNSPTVVATWKPGMPRPGDEVQRRRVNLRTVPSISAGAAVFAYTDSIPQSSGGAELFTQAITPTSALNVMEIRTEVNASENAAEQTTIALFQDSQSDCLDAASVYCNNTQQMRIELQHDRIAGTTSSVTYKVRGGTATGGGATLTINGAGGARKFGGVLTSYMTVREVWA